MHRWIAPLLLATLLSATLPPASATKAQTTGSASIAFPLAGHPVQGKFAITGTAVLSQFDRYKVEFAYDPNPTDTWFLLGEPGRVPITNDILAEWDVSGISDGNYMLRLRVFAVDGTYLDAVVRGIIVQNKPPASPSPAPTPTLPFGIESTPAPTQAVLPSPTPPAGGAAPVITPTPILSGRSEDDALSQTLGQLGRAFWSGVRWTVLAFVLLGMYAGVHRAFRADIRRWVRRTWTDLQK